MKTYMLKLSSGTAYKLYDGTTLVTDADLGTLFGAAGSAYFVFDFDSGTPSDLTAVSITNSSDTEVMGITGLAAGTVKENYNFKGAWDGATTTFTSFTQLTGQAMDEAQLGFLMGKMKESLGDVGKARVLTTADYNWNSTTGAATGTLNSIAFWLLEDGLYSNPSKLKISYTKRSGTITARAFLVMTGPSQAYSSLSGKIMLYTAMTSWGSSSQGYMFLGGFSYDVAADSFQTSFAPLNSNLVQDTLTSTITNLPLSAKQGKVLNEKITPLQPLTGTVAPDTTTVGTVGKMYVDTTNQNAYICVAANTGTSTYTWKQITS